MDVSLVIRQRLLELGLEQKDLAPAAEVTESYISQLLTRKKSPPAPDRTDIYDKIERILRVPRGNLSRLADLQRKDELKRLLSMDPKPIGIQHFGNTSDALMRQARNGILERPRDGYAQLGVRDQGQQEADLIAAGTKLVKSGRF